jgi:hypothetical protein
MKVDHVLANSPATFKSSPSPFLPSFPSKKNYGKKRLHDEFQSRISYNFSNSDNKMAVLDVAAPVEVASPLDQNLVFLTPSF